jgi:ElaB/YqjD/DUF883 family membrane-anchored ribosome-binding protein
MLKNLDDSNTINKANGAATDFLNKISAPGNQLDKMAHSAGERAGSMAAEFINSASSTAKSGREYVQENPIKGVAIAAAAGVVAGSLLTMIMRRSPKN